MTSVPAGTVAPLEYNRDVRPILSENCFACHGADSASRKAKLRLSKLEEATAKHEDTPPAIVPGRPAESELVRRIFDAGDDLMRRKNPTKCSQKEKMGGLPRVRNINRVVSHRTAKTAPAAV